MLATFYQRQWWAILPSGPFSLEGTLDLTKAHFEWSPGLGGGGVAEYHLKVGTAPGSYTLPVVIVVPPMTSVIASLVVSSPGTYYATVSAVNQFGESVNSNEIKFTVGLAITALSS